MTEALNILLICHIREVFPEVWVDLAGSLSQMFKSCPSLYKEAKLTSSSQMTLLGQSFPFALRGLLLTLCLKMVFFYGQQFLTQTTNSNWLVRFWVFLIMPLLVSLWNTVLRPDFRGGSQEPYFEQGILDDSQSLAMCLSTAGRTWRSGTTYCILDRNILNFSQWILEWIMLTWTK